MSTKRSRNINIRVTEEELALIKTRAQQANMTVSRFMLYAAFKQPITVYEIDRNALLRPVIDLRRHYNTIRYRMQQSGSTSPIISAKLEQEILELWRLLALGKQVEAPSEVCAT